jgi:hypothetical protein
MVAFPWQVPLLQGGENGKAKGGYKDPYACSGEKKRD